VADFFAKKKAGQAASWQSAFSLRSSQIALAKLLPHRKRPPQIAAIPTRIQGAIFQNCRQQKSNNASEKLFGESIALVQIG
jgi:hypothetical protein